MRGTVRSSQLSLCPRAKPFLKREHPYLWNTKLICCSAFLQWSWTCYL